MSNKNVSLQCLIRAMSKKAMILEHMTSEKSAGELSSQFSLFDKFRIFLVLLQAPYLQNRFHTDLDYPKFSNEITNLIKKGVLVKD